MHPFDILELNNGAKFIFTPCPGTKDTSISDAFNTLVEAGADAVITLLSDDELTALSVPTFSHEAAQKSFEWFQLPIEDDCEPEQPFQQAWTVAEEALLALVNDKKTIAIHCRGGSGRTGLMAAILLFESGEQWPNIQAQIQSIRPKALTHPAHISYLQKHYSIGGNYDY
ncbi:protein phosphatase [Aestuariirhabdus sp. Z084]|uniref:phosphatase domain-containing protein n=1 Tax=Aestuariirhabdus haliotis TaxID=2918751 RepID=UPI0020BFDF9C|nr:protein phosphatase [Aestuariirhabdus haliotis]MCL6417251.1 protein phosphatase [Aestuariirhabdus haliotis]